MENDDTIPKSLVGQPVSGVVNKTQFKDLTAKDFYSQLITKLNSPTGAAYVSLTDPMTLNTAPPVAGAVMSTTTLFNLAE